ncbi:hypothetical protein G4Y79_18230 [Phototrophicus methaneseepsis]|uniref:Uncharacterized protein n=1 Tax=Phototrophicus methaneseepsis TaxID=2710758 RepID=A0A7S8IDJ2_9CHLR|nr:hypothetical protein [Phototrophicus methaneseepsis]QPC81612.1 hypothetical protein G4Y79_18230 [Phototrophicus methaneseepsis]
MVQHREEETIIRTPASERPRYGWDAWLAIIGYLAEAHSPDALLRLALTSEGDGTIKWSATVQWGNQTEVVHNSPSLSEAMISLWRTVEANHRLFNTPQDRLHSPASYAADIWLDERSFNALDSLVTISQRLYQDDWHLVFVYQPSELSYMRVQARLLACQYTIYKGGRGATLREACQSLYHNAMDLFTAHFKRTSDNNNHEEKR